MSDPFREWVHKMVESGDMAPNDARTVLQTLDSLPSPTPAKRDDEWLFSHRDVKAGFRWGWVAGLLCGFAIGWFGCMGLNGIPFVR